MLVRIVTTRMASPVDLGLLDLDALPRAGEGLLTRDGLEERFWTAKRVIHVEGAYPMVFVLPAEDDFLQQFAAVSHLAPSGSLNSLV